MVARSKGYIEYDDLFREKTTDLEKVGRVSAASVLKHTGRNWEQWVTLLEKAGARSWSHREIAAYLKSKYRLTPWWQQGVALGFEIATGRRKEGQDANGKYTITATKSLPFGATEVWKALLSAEGQRIWLDPLADLEILAKAQFETADGYFGEVRTVARSKRIRLYWQDPEWDKHTVVEVHLVAKPARKSILVFNHTGIPDARTRDRLRARWRGAADRMLKHLRGL